MDSYSKYVNHSWISAEAAFAAATVTVAATTAAATVAVAAATATAAAAAAASDSRLPWTPAAIVLVVTISKDIGIRLPHPKYPDFKLPPNILIK